MKTAIIQFIEIEGIMTIEFKLVEDDKVLVSSAKCIESVDDYEVFMEHLTNKLSPLEDYVLHHLKQKAKKKVMANVL
ncbi:MAG: hypothetical protein R2764_01365 [Bacteroidales bacterium]